MTTEQLVKKIKSGSILNESDLSEILTYLEWTNANDGLPPLDESNVAGSKSSGMSVLTLIKSGIRHDITLGRYFHNLQMWSDGDGMLSNVTEWRRI